MKWNWTCGLKGALGWKSGAAGSSFNPYTSWLCKSLAGGGVREPLNLSVSSSLCINWLDLLRGTSPNASICLGHLGNCGVQIQCEHVPLMKSTRWNQAETAHQCLLALAHAWYLGGGVRQTNRRVKELCQSLQVHAPYAVTDMGKVQPAPAGFPILLVYLARWQCPAQGRVTHSFIPYWSSTPTLAGGRGQWGRKKAEQ